MVGQPSSKTDYVVLGDSAGQSKLAAIKKHNLKSLSEDEFLNLIATRKGPGNGKGLSEKEKKKKDKEEKAIRDSAKEMEAREKAIETSGSGVARGCAGTLSSNWESKIDTVTGPRQLTPRRNFGPIDMPRKHSKRFAATKGKSKNSNNGLVTGEFSRLSVYTTEPADDILQVWQFESQF